ncbi:Nn.00g034150.m01.CDS01 [Neocucurbitaria sp. VM-36]
MTTGLIFNRKMKSRTRMLSKARDGTITTRDISTTYVQVSQPFPESSYPNHQDLEFDDDRKIWPARHIEEHPFVETIREGVLQYRLQSASHFDIPIEVHQTRSSAYAVVSTHLSPSFKIEILFHDFNNRKLYRICRLKSRKSSHKIPEVPAGNIQVREYDRNVSLNDFLNARFPTWPEAVKAETLHAWWNENGKTFEWTMLPTELKERIIQFCMHRSQDRNYGHRVSYSPDQRARRRKVPHEVTNILRGWLSLLHVSHQVRAITLRLCSVGSSDVALSEGLTVVASSNFEFKDRIRCLRYHYQLVEPNGIPVDEKTSALADTYKRFPKIFPELKQYATLWHGIRRVSLQMGFLDYFNFFKVTVGGFERFWRPNHVDYELFEQLPHLNELIINLPDITGRLEDKPAQPSPPLFYEDFVCPRILHQFIYEQAAEVLAPYQNVKMYGFIDESEALRFRALRENTRRNLKFTTKELDELYAEGGGGVELEESVKPGVKTRETEDKSMHTQLPIEYQRDFWPPKCDCAVRCRKLLLRGRYN